MQQKSQQSDPSGMPQPLDRVQLQSQCGLSQHMFQQWLPSNWSQPPGLCVQPQSQSWIVWTLRWRCGNGPGAGAGNAAGLGTGGAGTGELKGETITGMCGLGAGCRTGIGPDAFTVAVLTPQHRSQEVQSPRLFRHLSPVLKPQSHVFQSSLSSARHFQQTSWPSTPRRSVPRSTAARAARGQTMMPTAQVAGV